MSENRWYPEQIIAGNFGGAYAKDTVDFLSKTMQQSPDNEFVIAEIGIWKGATSIQFARLLNGAGQLHLFDYEDNVNSVCNSLKAAGFDNVTPWPSSYKYLDSYNWSLMKILRESAEPLFDYIYIDGAHTWAIDALTFFLGDLLLKPGGHIDFDDYNWKLRNSSLDPRNVPETAQLYTDEQIDEPQVKLVVDILVRRNPKYQEVIPNKIFRKIG